MSARANGSKLWLLHRVDGNGRGLFVGTLAEMLAHIGKLHAEQGVRWSGTAASH